MKCNLKYSQRFDDKVTRVKEIGKAIWWKFYKKSEYENEGDTDGDLYDDMDKGPVKRILGYHISTSESNFNDQEFSKINLK